MSGLSARGAAFIGHYEGWRDTPYNDPTNNATIGFGHLIHMGPLTPHDVKEWGKITRDHGIQLLQGDASVADAAINHTITRPLAQCERDALTSFAYNCGGGSLSGSVGRAVNAKQDPTAALEQFVHSGHVVLAGLVARRKAEALLFTSGDYGDSQPPAPPAAPRMTPKPAASADGDSDAGSRLGVAVGRVEARPRHVQGPRERPRVAQRHRCAGDGSAVELDVPQTVPVASALSPRARRGRRS